MTAELKELRQHIRWLEDERLYDGAVEEHLDEIDGRLDGINDGLATLVNAFNGIADALKGIADGLNALAPKGPPPPGPGDVLNEFFKAPNGRKERAAKPPQTQAFGRSKGRRRGQTMSEPRRQRIDADDNGRADRLPAIRGGHTCSIASLR
jgi:hypothetical protein